MTVRSRLEAWWQGALVARRDRCVELVAPWWEGAVLDRRDRVLDRVAVSWEGAVLDRRDRVLDRVAAWWEGKRIGADPRSRPAELSLALALGVVLAAAAAGSVAAISAPWKEGEPERVISEGPARSRSAAPHDERVAVRLGAIVEQLRIERSRTRELLAHSRTAKRQGSAARSLADAYRSGAASLATVADGERTSVAVRAAMRAAAESYDALAIAAVTGDRRRFSNARGRVASTEEAVASTLARLTEPPS